MWRKYFHNDVMMMYYMLKCFKYVIMFYILQVISMTMLKFMMFKLYYHEVCYLNKQVITKLKAVSYHPFSSCRPKGIKEIVFPCYVCFILVTEDLLPSLTIGWARSTRYDTMIRIL